MSGFSPDWLDLRERADHRARNSALLETLADTFAGRDTLRVLDLGCGTGSTLRAVHDRLPRHQAWTLVDHDPALLVAAELRLMRSGFEETGSPPLRRTRNGSDIKVAFRQADLTKELVELAELQPDLITASALIDLVSADWIDDLAKFAASRGAVVYAALNYNGQEVWSPPHAADEDVLAAFVEDQRRDKGFGPALGPKGTETLATALRHRGYRVEIGPSPWRLDTNDRHLIDALASGISDAVSPPLGSDTVENWLSARRQALAVEIGHLDLLAVPEV